MLMGRDPREDSNEPADEVPDSNPVSGGDKKESGEVMALVASEVENESNEEGMVVA
jgi:hypothetical protein